MPITLTTPHYDNTQVTIRVVGIDLRNKEIVLTVEYGDTVSNVWTPSTDHTAEIHVIKNYEMETDGEVELVAADPIYDTLTTAAKATITFDDKSADPRYAKVVLNHPTHGNLDVYVELSYVAVKRQFYQWLLDEEIYAGVIV